jgi:transcriptional regulator with AAA-type ATPase domain
MKAGAYDYMTKPFSLEELRLLLARVASHLKLKTENRVLREKIKSRQGFGSLIGRAPEMDKLYRIIAKAAHSIHPVLVLGESGTGKEMVARAHSLLWPIARQAVYSRGLRLSGTHPDRERIIWLRERRIHRRNAV